jgi:hypothetical protein
MKPAEHSKALPKGSLTAELAAAFAAGLAAAFLTILVKLLDRQVVALATYGMYTLTAVASYSATALLLHQLWTGLPARIAPRWVLTAFLGSTLFILIRLTPGMVGGWYDPLRLQPSLLDYIATEVTAARSLVVVLSLMTLPITGLVYLLTCFFLRWQEKRDLVP